MSTNTKTLIARAAINTALLGNGGKMNPEQAEKFISYMVDNSPFLKSIQVINMTSTRRDLDSIELGIRAMRKQSEGTEVDATGTVTHAKRSLSAVGVVMPYDISYQYKKENLEGKNIDETLARLFARQFGNDTLDLAFNGDESSSDAFVKINNGWIKIGKTDTNTHKVDTASLGSDYLNKIFPAMLDSLPPKYIQTFMLEDNSLIKFFVSPATARAYKEQLQTRNTALGDAMITGGKLAKYDGYDIVPNGYIPDGVVILTPQTNLVYGIYGGNIEHFKEEKPRRATTEHTILADTDFEIANPDAFVIAYNATPTTTPTTPPEQGGNS